MARYWNWVRPAVHHCVVGSPGVDGAYGVEVRWLRPLVRTRQSRCLPLIFPPRCLKKNYDRLARCRKQLPIFVCLHYEHQEAAFICGGLFLTFSRAATRIKD